jgi:transcriptional regulator with XRE-family HTH domain
MFQILRAEMRAAGVTYKLLAQRMGMSESSIKRIFAQKDMTLTRLAQVCKAAGIAMEDVLRKAADAAPHVDMLTLAQERSLVADPKLLLIAICCLGNWSIDQILDTYALTESECVRKLVALDRLGLIELRPLNRYRLIVSNTFHWRPDGPVQQYFRDFVVSDYFDGRFDGPGESLLCVPARLSLPSAQEVVQKIRRLAADLARLHHEDRRLQPEERDGFTLLIGLRSWEFSAFTALRRQADATPAHQIGPRKR